MQCSIIQNYQSRLSISETGLSNADMSHSDLKFKITSIDKMKSQLETRISQLERHNDRLCMDLAKEESYLASLEERISLVHDNYADGENNRIANELNRLNFSTSFAQLAKIIA